MLSAESKQGVRQFLNELSLIAKVTHENLVRLDGCCMEGDHMILIFSYLPMNSLAQTLLCTTLFLLLYFAYAKGNFNVFAK